MKSPLARRNHIERHHGREHVAPGQSPAQHRRIGDAVLQTDDDGVRRRVTRDRFRDLGRIGALDGDQHHAGVGENLGSSDSVNWSGAMCRIEPRSSSRSAQNFRSPRSRAVAPATRRGGRRSRHAADKAADAAGAGHDDRSIQGHPAILLPDAVFDSRLYRSPPLGSTASASDGRSPCNRHTPPVWSPGGAAHGRR